MTIGLALAGLAAVAAATKAPWHEWADWRDAPWNERHLYATHRRLDKNEIGKVWIRMVRMNEPNWREPETCGEAIDLATRRSVDYGVYVALADKDPDPGWRANRLRDQASDAVRSYIGRAKKICKVSP